jgi:putative peptidoglycan lipid II flippase
MNLVFVPLLAHTALALTIGLGAMINAGWLLRGLIRLGVYRPAPGWAGFGARVFVACAVLGALLAWAAAGFDWFGAQARPLWRAGVMAGVLGGVALLYFGTLAALGVNLRQFSRRA